MFCEANYLFKFTNLRDKASLSQHLLSLQLSLNACSAACDVVLHRLNEVHPFTEIISRRRFKERQVILAHSRPDSPLRFPAVLMFKLLNMWEKSKYAKYSIFRDLYSKNCFNVYIQTESFSKQLSSTKTETESQLLCEEHIFWFFDFFFF